MRRTHPPYKLLLLIVTLSSLVSRATGQVVVEEVTDLDAVDDGNGASTDLNELLDLLESENVETSSGGVDDVDDMRSDGCTAAVDETPAVVDDESNPAVDEQFIGGTSDQQDKELATNESSDNSDLNETITSENSEQQHHPPPQKGPFIDIFGDVLLSLEMVDETHAQVHQHFTNEALAGKKVVGLYFSADWCGPCRQFTPDLVTFYDKMNSRRGKQDEFEIVWISRCRSIDDFGQYFTHMKWLALPPQEAMGQRGQHLGDKYKVKSIPTLVLLDEIGNVITTDARNKIPMDKAGIGFPWKSPMSVLISALVPRSMRLLLKNHVGGIVDLIKKVILGGNHGGGRGGLGEILNKLRDAVQKRGGGQR